MNILHHKSWHVRTKKNIEKVRRDEQRALEEQIEKARKADIAEQERRIQQLRSKFSVSQPDDHQIATSDKGHDQLHQNEKAHQRYKKDNDSIRPKNDVRPNDQDADQQLPVVRSGKQHINFFQAEYETTKNKAHALEKKIEQETWEKKVGILTYLGGNQPGGKSELPWYEKLPTQLDNQPTIGCRESSAIQREDPLSKIKTELNRRKKDEEDLKKRKQFLLDRKERSANKFNKFRDGYDRLKTSRRPDDRRRSSETTAGSSAMQSEDRSQRGSQSQPDNRPDSELSEKELKLALLRQKRLKREQKEQKKSKDLAVTQSPFFCLDDRQRAYLNQFNPHLARR